MPRDLAADVNGIKFTGIAAVGQQVRDLELTTDELGPAIGIALGRSRLSGLRTVRGVLDSAPDAEQGTSEATAIVNWAAGAGADERRLVAEAARLDNRSLVLVHHLTALPRALARPFVADYFTAGGGMRAVAEWLRLAGGVLRERGKAPGTDGFVGDAVDAVGHALGEAADAIAEGVGTLVDAVVSAGKALVNVVTEVVNWSVQQVADLVHALIEAGKSVGEILGAALAAGAASLRKFVRAAVAAGRAIGEALAWAAGAGTSVP